MKALDLDYCPRSRWRSPIGWAMLLLALVAMALTLETCVRQRQGIASLENILIERGQSDVLDAAPVSADAVSPEEQAAISAVLSDFSTPWVPMFQAVEAVQLDAVAVTAIEPDTAKGAVVLSAEADDYLDVLTYVARLSAQPGLNEVRLVQHELREGGSRRVQFSVSARWKPESGQ